MKKINRDSYLNEYINKIFYKYLCKNYDENKIIKYVFDSHEDFSLIGEDYIDIHLNKRKVSSKNLLNI